MNIIAVVVTIDESVQQFELIVEELRAHCLFNIAEDRTLGIVTGDVEDKYIPSLEMLPAVLAVEIAETLRGQKS